MSVTAADYEDVLHDQRRLVRELDVMMNGSAAAKQASLCDVVGSFPQWLRAHDEALLEKFKRELMEHGA